MKDGRRTAMTEINHDQHVQTQRNEWNSVAGAWEKWDRWLDETMSVFDRVLMERAGVREGHRVLDLGSGTGYPAIHAARQVGAGGKVIGLDIAERMLEVARRKAGALGLDHLSFRTCDVSALPFGEGDFDAATSRFCLMFLPDVDATLREVRRALAAEAVFAAAVWAGPEKNPAFSAPMKILREVAGLAPPGPAKPGLFSLQAPGALKNKFVTNGFSNVHEEEVRAEWTFFSVDEYLANLREMAAPMKSILASLSAGKVTEAEERIAEAVGRFEGEDGALHFSGHAFVVSGVKGRA